MNGFFGKNSVVHDFEGNGHVIGNNIRFFGFTLITSRVSFVRKERMIYDLDAIGPTPDFSYKTSLGNIAFDNNTLYNTITETDAAFLGASSGGSIIGYPAYYRYGNSWSGVGFNSAVALSPATRKFRLKVSRPDLISGFSLNTINGGVNSASINLQSVSPFTLDLRRYNNLKIIGLTTGIFVASLTIKLIPNSKLENFFVTSSALTSLSVTLPSTTKVIQIGSSLTSVSSAIANCTGCEALTFGHPAGGYAGLINQTNTLTGTLDISHMTALKVLTLPQNASLSALTLPTGKSDWVWVHIASISASVRSTISTTALSDMLASSTMKAFVFFSNQLSWSKAITDTDLLNANTYFAPNNSIAGNITLTTSRPNLWEFKTGNITSRGGTQLNSHPIVDITGLTGAISIDLTGCEVEDLELPVNTVCTNLYLYSNELDIVTNSNLITQVNAMTALVDLRFSANTSVQPSGSHVGQTSTNGLGAVNISSLVNLVTLCLSSCKVTSLTVASVNKLTTLVCAYNPSLAGITNLNSHTSLITLILYGCDAYAQNISSSFTALRVLGISNTLMTSIDISGKTTTGVANGLQLNMHTNPNLTTVTLPPTEATSMMNTSMNVEIYNCASLTSLVNMEYLNWGSVGTSNNRITIHSNALDIVFPLGANNFIPRGILIQDNGMSQSNVDDTIDSMYTNRAKWNVYSAAKSMNISGTNAAPSGTYQAPAGFSLGVSDGTPASAKEQLYVLVNNYNWTITFN